VHKHYLVSIKLLDWNILMNFHFLYWVKNNSRVLSMFQGLDYLSVSINEPDMLNLFISLNSKGMKNNNPFLLIDAALTLLALSILFQLQHILPDPCSNELLFLIPNLIFFLFWKWFFFLIYKYLIYSCFMIVFRMRKLNHYFIISIINKDGKIFLVTM